MKKVLLLVGGVLVGAAAWAQLRITSFNSSGELTWTNSVWVGAYGVEWGNSPTGSWNGFDMPTNLNCILVETNHATAQLPLSNPPPFYRVVWMPPSPIGVWDYRSYDANGVLAVTGLLTLARGTHPSAYYGWREFKYAGPPTNNYYGWLGWQIGTGGVAGAVVPLQAYLYLSYPTNCSDCNSGIGGTVWPNTYTGLWNYYTLFDRYSGPFSAVRRPASATNSSSQLPSN